MSRNMSGYEHLYGISLLDDLHNYFPSILYRPQQFSTVQDLLQYISRQTQSQFNLFDRGLRRFEQTHRTLRANPLIQPIRATATATSSASLPRQTVGSSLDTPYVNMVTETFDLMPILTSLGTGSGTTRTVGSSTIPGLNELISLFRGELNMEPVQVRPTQQQINTATHVFESLNDDHTDAVCSICQDGFTENILIRQIRHCNHMFHRQCIDQWLQQNVHCPVCRFDIREHGALSTRSTISAVVNE
jgi:hypothetical protein